MELFTIDNISGTPIGLLLEAPSKQKILLRREAGLKGLVGGKLYRETNGRSPAKQSKMISKQKHLALATELV